MNYITRILIEEGDFEHGDGGDLAVNEGLAEDGAEAGIVFNDLGDEGEGVAGAGFGAVVGTADAGGADVGGGGILGDFGGCVFDEVNEAEAELADGFNLEGAGVNGIGGEVAGEEGKIGVEVVFAGEDAAFGAEGGEAVHEEEGMTMGEDAVQAVVADIQGNGQFRGEGDGAPAVGMEGLGFAGH